MARPERTVGAVAKTPGVGVAMSSQDRDFWLRLWFRTAARGAALVATYFVLWELTEHLIVARWRVDVHPWHLVRGMGAAFLLGTWSFLQIRQARSERDAALEAQLRHQEKMASLGELAAGFAHDLGNPLASLSTELELLEDEQDIARFRESLGVLRRQVSRMSRTLREMVDFARRRREEETDVSIALAVEDSARLLCHDPRWKRVALSVEIPADIPSIRMVDDHLVLVLVNLMLNAADAMPAGGSLSVRALRRGDDVEIRLLDTGVGMTPEVLSRAMTPLFSTKAPGRGTGLGLSISGSIVRAAGGTLRLQSTEGVGTEVTITLPTRRLSDG